VSEDFSIQVVGLRCFVTLCKTAPYRNSLTYLLLLNSVSIIVLFGFNTHVSHTFNITCIYPQWPAVLPFFPPNGKMGHWIS